VSAPRKRMGRDPNEPKTSAMDMLPDWVGYSMLYGVCCRSCPVQVAFMKGRGLGMSTHRRVHVLLYAYALDRKDL
jgi:hypothetical protein